MNKIICLLVSASLLSSGVVFAQGELDVLFALSLAFF